MRSSDSVQNLPLGGSLYRIQIFSVYFHLPKRYYEISSILNVLSDQTINNLRIVKTNVKIAN